MEENKLFEYAVIRYVPRPEREEFMNIGVILYCKGADFLNMKFDLDEQRIKCFFAGADTAELRRFLNAYQEVCCGNAVSSPISKLDKASRFRWLTATRSTIVQASKVHPGFCLDPLDKLQKLHEQLVLD